MAAAKLTKPTIFIQSAATHYTNSIHNQDVTFDQNRSLNSRRHRCRPGSTHVADASPLTKRGCYPIPASEATNGNALTCKGQAASLIDYDDYMQSSMMPTACSTPTADAPKFMAAIPGGGKHCGETIEIKNPHVDDRSVTVTVVDDCIGSCGEIGTGDGSTMLINENAFNELFGEDVTEGRYDVEYEEL